MEIPPRLSRRPLYAGLPVPYTTCVGNDGIPDFKVNDREAVDDCAFNRKCGLCGEALEPVICFIGGEKSIQSCMFLDAPLHEECALYAAKVCPFLSRSDRGYARDDATRLSDQGLIVLHSKLIDRHNVTRMMGILYCREFEYGLLRGERMPVFLAKGVFKLDAHTMPESD